MLYNSFWEDIEQYLLTPSRKKKKLTHQRKDCVHVWFSESVSSLTGWQAALGKLNYWKTCTNQVSSLYKAVACILEGRGLQDDIWKAFEPHRSPPPSIMDEYYNILKISHGSSLLHVSASAWWWPCPSGGSGRCSSTVFHYIYCYSIHALICFNTYEFSL